MAPARRPRPRLRPRLRPRCAGSWRTQPRAASRPPTAPRSSCRRRTAPSTPCSPSRRTTLSRRTSTRMMPSPISTPTTLPPPWARRSPTSSTRSRRMLRISASPGRCATAPRCGPGYRPIEAGSSSWGSGSPAAGRPPSKSRRPRAAVASDAPSRTHPRGRVHAGRAARGTRLPAGRARKRGLAPGGARRGLPPDRGRGPVPQGRWIAPLRRASDPARLLLRRRVNARRVAAPGALPATPGGAARRRCPTARSSQLLARRTVRRRCSLARAVRPRPDRVPGGSGPPAALPDAAGTPPTRRCAPPRPGQVSAARRRSRPRHGSRPRLPRPGPRSGHGRGRSAGPDRPRRRPARTA